MPLDNLTYTDALECYITGDSAGAVNAIRSLFIKDVFDPFAAIIFMACSATNSATHGTLKAAFGAKQYGRLLTIASRLKLHRHEITGTSQPIRTSPVMNGAYPIPADKAAARILRSKSRYGESKP
jgi:hypothetical protein